MRHKKVIVICFTLLLLMIASVAQADLVFDEEQNGGTFSQEIIQNARATVGDIPVGVTGLRVELNCASDVDVELYDLDDANKAVIAWSIGLIDSSGPTTFDYKAMSINYSGYDGVDSVKGHETIEISGTTTANLRIVAFGYEAGTATVNYTYTEYVPVDTGYDLAYTAGPHGSITGEANQTVNHAGTGTAVTAVPDEGYHFVDWSDGVVTATRTDSDVMGDLAVTANFAINNYTLTYAAGEHGSIAGDTEQQVTHGASGTLVTAQPDPGYYFVNWSDGNDTAARRDVDVTGEISVTANFAPKVAITVTADGQSKVYGNDDPSFTYQVTDGALEGGDSFSGSLGRAAGEDVGSYPIDQGTLSAGPKYQITFVPADLAISQRSLQVTANSREKTYGEPDPALTHQVTGGSLVNGDQLTGALTRLSGEDVGEYQILQGTLTAGGNYALSFVPASLAVNVKTIQVTADAKSKHYGDADPSLTYQVTGLVGTDALTGSLTRVAGEEINSYAINQGDLSAGGNYLINFTPGSFAVTRRPLTVTAVDVTKVYDGQASSFDVSYAGFAPDEDASVLAGTLVISGDAVGATSAGEYTIVPGGLSSGNYQISFVSGQLSIQPRALTVTADDQQKIYDGDPFEGFTASYSGFVSGEDERVLAGTLSFDGDAVTLTSAGSHEIAPGGLVSSNYAITFVSGTLTIHKRPVTVTAHDQGKVYGEADPVLTYSLTTGELVGSDSLSGTPTRTAGEGVGEYAIKIGSVQISDNYAISFVQGTLTVTEREIALLADAKSKIYGDPDPVFTYQMISGTLVGGDSFSGALSRVAGVTVGSYQIGLGSLTAGDNYRITLTPANLVITAKEITVTADDQSKIYGDEDPALTYHVAGLVSSDSCSGVLQRQAGETVGLYPISQGSLTAGANYTISFVAGDLAINPRPLTVTAVPRSKQYDGSPYSDFTVSYDGFAFGDGAGCLGGELAFGGSAAGAVAVGVYEINPSGLTSDDYALTFVSGTLSITRRDLIVTADSLTKTYDGENYAAFTVSYVGFAAGDSPAVLTGTPTFGGQALTAVNAGSHELTVTGLAGANYTITYQPGILTILPRPLQVTADDQSKTYGEADPVLSYRITAGSLCGDDSLSGELRRAEGDQVGEYAILQGSLEANSNYALNYREGSLTIAKRVVTVTADAKSKVYGEADPVLTYRVTAGSLVDGDSFSGALACGGVNVGAHDIELGSLGLGDDADNYNLSFVPAALTITARSVTVTADEKGKVYGDLDPALTYQVSGLVIGDSLSGSLARDPGEGVNSYAIRQGSLVASANYALNFVGADLTIGKRTLTVSAVDAAKVYDGQPYSGFSVTYDNFAPTEDQGVLSGTLGFSGNAVAAVNAGTYEIIPGGLESGNYAFTYVPGELNITKRGLTVTADDQSKVYDGAAFTAFSVSYSGFAGSDDEHDLAGPLVYGGSAATEVDAGTYAIVPAGLTANNYSISFVNGELTITKRQLVATAGNYSKAYGSDNPGFIVDVTGFIPGEDAGTAAGYSAPTASCEATVTTGVGTAEVAVSGGSADNYSFQRVPGTLTINRKELIATAIATGKTYDGTIAASGSINLSGIVNEDDVTATGTFRFADPNAGSGKAVQVTDITLAGDKAGNYTLASTSVNATADISKADISGVGFLDASLDYDGYAHELLITGELPDGASASYSSNVGTGAGTYLARAEISGGQNYNDLTLNATLQVRKAPLTVTVDDASKIYGETNPGFVLHVTGFVREESEASAAGYRAPTAECIASETTAVGTVPITISAGLADNYSFDVSHEGTLTIVKKELTAKAVDCSKTYGSGNPEFAVEVTGFIPGENAGNAAGYSAPTAACTATDATDVGTAEIELSGGSASNYTFSNINGVLTINRKALTAVIQVDDKFYDGNDTAAGRIGLQGVVGDDDVVASGNFRFADRNVGTGIAVAVSGITLSGDKAANYTVASAASGSANINPRPITVTADTQSKVYGEQDPALTYRVTAGTLVDGDAFQGSLTRDVGEDVDGYAIQQGTLTAGSNYDLTYVSKDLTISQRPITVTAEAKTKVYGEVDPALTYQITLGDLVDGDAISGGLARVDGTSVGTYEIRQGTLTAGNNYALTYVSADFEITRKEISASGITARSKYWDGATTASLDTSNAGLVGVEPGDDVQLDVSHASGAFADANLGVSKQVMVTDLALVGADAGNYLLNAYTTTASIVDEPEPPKPPTPPAGNGDVVIIVNGEVQEQSATATTTVVEDKTITTVTIDPQKLAERLEQEGDNSTVTVPVNTGADVVTGALTGQSVKQMEAKSAVLEIKTENVTYTLPAAQINIDAVAEQIGGNVSLQDVNVRVQVAAPAADTARVVEDTANRNNYQVVVRPVEFSVTCEHAGRVVEVNRFNAYVERMVAVPDGVDPSKITTGIVLNADGTFSHVPTTIVTIDGKYYAKINSLTNSVYSVIWNPIEFQDMVGHWAKGPVNDMGSRLVMEGDSSEVFGPNRAITRGEFAATIVKALGLRPATGDSPFVDLHAGDQYYGHILTAYQYGIMNGLPGNKFGAETELTRQEAMAIVVSAMRLTELSSTLSSTEVNATLATYADSARVSGWARNVVAACLKSGIIGGRPGQLIAPQEMITRAEAAAIMQRFLRQSGLI